MTSQALVIRGDAKSLPLPDESVDLIITSPPYFALRSYRDNGEHYADQIGSEATPQEFLEALWTCCREWWRVLKPQGSLFVNLGDKRAGSGGHNNSGLAAAPDSMGLKVCPACGYEANRKRCNKCGESMKWPKAEVNGATRRNAPDRYNQASFGRPKSKMLLPHRFAIGCEDGLADPEGKGWIVRQDLIWQKLNGLPESVTDRHRDSHEFIFHLTKQERYFAAMDEVRQPHVYPDDNRHERGPRIRYDGVIASGNTSNGNPLGKLPGSVWPMASEPLLIPQWAKDKYDLGDHFAAFPTELPRKLILGFSPPAGVILDPFGGTGTVSLVAKTLGRIGISVDLSSDYCKLAHWRINHSGHGKKAEQRTWGELQGALEL